MESTTCYGFPSLCIGPCKVPVRGKGRVDTAALQCHVDAVALQWH